MPDDLMSLSYQESENLREGISRIQTLFAKDITAKDKFFENPFDFLQKNSGITLLDSIGNAEERILDFNNSIKSLFSKLTNVFNSCFGCKLAALIIIYALLAEAGAGVLAVLDFLDMIVTNLERFFRKTGDLNAQWLDSLRTALDSITPESLALNFCRHIGKCNDMQTIKVPVEIPVQPVEQT